MSDLRAFPDDEQGGDFLESIRQSWVAYTNFVASNPLPEGKTWSSTFAEFGEAVVQGLAKGLAEGLTTGRGEETEP